MGFESWSHPSHILMGGGSAIWAKAHWCIHVLVSQDSKLKRRTRWWSVPSVSIHLIEKNNPQKYIFHFWPDTCQKLDSIFLFYLPNFPGNLGLMHTHITKYRNPFLTRTKAAKSKTKFYTKLSVHLDAVFYFILLLLLYFITHFLKVG